MGAKWPKFSRESKSQVWTVGYDHVRGNVDFPIPPFIAEAEVPQFGKINDLIDEATDLLSRCPATGEIGSMVGGNIIAY